jgi:hypothetical protein
MTFQSEEHHANVKLRECEYTKLETKLRDSEKSLDLQKSQYNEELQLKSEQILQMQDLMEKFHQENA